MKIFLDTAYLKDIRYWLQTGLIDGVTTNPSNLAKEGTNPTNIVLEICSLLGDKDVSIEVTEIEPELVYKQAKAIAALAKNVVVKIPCHKDYYTVINRLVTEGVRINVTLLFTLTQALLMCKLGVVYISPFVGRWDDIDTEGSDILYSLREMIDRYGYKTEILAASLRHIRHVNAAIASGADVATMPISVLEKATEHILTDKGMELFAFDWQKNGPVKFPSAF